MLTRLEKWFLPFVAGAVVLFGIGLFSWADYRTTVVNWNVAWGVFDIVLGGVIFATWWTARRGHWFALVLAGALTAMQLVDVWFSLVVYYDIAERPGILGWAFIGQPFFAWFTWRFVLRRVPRPGHAVAPGAGHDVGTPGQHAGGPTSSSGRGDATTGVRVVTE